jgi:rod shape-determining protein MreB
VKGRCLLTGLPKLFPIHTEEMLEAFDESCEGILDAIRDVLERTPPELVSDISENGITLTGGGSRLKGLAEALEEHAHIPVLLADDGEDCVIAGITRVLGKLDEMQDGPLNLMRRKQLT